MEVSYTIPYAQVFDLGADGGSAPRLAAEVPNFLRAAAAAGNGRDIFSERTPADRKGAAVVHIAVITPSQSHRWVPSSLPWSKCPLTLPVWTAYAAMTFASICAHTWAPCDRTTWAEGRLMSRTDHQGCGNQLTGRFEVSGRVPPVLTCYRDVAQLGTRGVVALYSLHC